MNGGCAAPPLAFRQTLIEVHTQYRGAKFEVDDHGMTLMYSLPPVHGHHLEADQGRLTAHAAPSTCGARVIDFITGAIAIDQRRCSTASQVAP